MNWRRLIKDFLRHLQGSTPVFPVGEPRRVRESDGNVYILFRGVHAQAERFL